MVPSTKTTIAVLCAKDNPALSCLPRDLDNVQFVIGASAADFEASEQCTLAQGLVVVPPTNNTELKDTIYPKLLPNVKWVHSFFAGVDALRDFSNEHLVNSSIPLTNGRGAFSESLAEYVMCTALYFNKQMPRWQSNKDSKLWDKFQMNVVSGKTMGFLGFGHIAQTTARMAKLGFGMKIIALNNSGNNPSGIADKVYTLEEKMKVFQESDFVVSTLPGTPDTVNFVGAAEFNAMKESAVFISCGRGTVVDENALTEALQSEKISGAALDVFQQEPLPESSPLWDVQNLLITAHNADLTGDYFELGWKVWQENLVAFQKGEELVTLVNKSAGY